MGHKKFVVNKNFIKNKVICGYFTQFKSRKERKITRSNRISNIKPGISFLTKWDIMMSKN